MGPMPQKIVVVLSTIFKVHGGIPRFNQMLCLALDQLAPELGLDVRVLSQDDADEDYLAHGAPWKHARFVPGGGQRSLALRTLKTCYTEFPSLLVVGLLGMTPLGVACLPAVRRGFGFVAHGTEAWDEPRWTRRFSARRARFAFAVSDHTRRSLARSTGIDPDLVRWLPNTLQPGFESAGSAASDPISEPAAGLELLTVARLDGEERAKGVDHSIEAFARLAPRYPPARYRIIGRGSDKPRLIELARSLSLGDRVVFEENLSDAELADAYRRCSMFLLPSGQEGFGIVFLEAMRFSKPCIGGNAGGTPEVIDDGRTGVLVPHGNVDVLESAIESLLADRDLRSGMGRAGRKRLDRLFVFGRFRERLAGHLRELLGPR